MNILQHVTDELAHKVSQVEAAIPLLDQGPAVPLISRYRKEVAESLDDAQTRHFMVTRLPKGTRALLV